MNFERSNFPSTYLGSVDRQLVSSTLSSNGYGRFVEEWIVLGT